MGAVLQKSSSSGSNNKVLPVDVMLSDPRGAKGKLLQQHSGGDAKEDSKKGKKPGFERSMSMGSVDSHVSRGGSDGSQKSMASQKSLQPSEKSLGSMRSFNSMGSIRDVDDDHLPGAPAGGEKKKRKVGVSHGVTLHLHVHVRPLTNQHTTCMCGHSFVSHGWEGQVGTSTSMSSRRIHAGERNFTWWLPPSLPPSLPLSKEGTEPNPSPPPSPSTLGTPCGGA